MAKKKLVKKEKGSLRSKKCFRLVRNSVANALLMKTLNSLKTSKLNMMIITRSKATWYEKGERSNKYFLKLESHNKSKSSVRKIFNGEGVLITDPRKVQQEIERFYSDLCKSDTLSPSENTLNSFLENPDVPKLSQVDAQVCEGKLTVSECFKSLQLFQVSRE